MLGVYAVYIILSTPIDLRLLKFLVVPKFAYQSVSSSGIFLSEGNLTWTPTDLSYEIVGTVPYQIKTTIYGREEDKRRSSVFRSVELTVLPARIANPTDAPKICDFLRNNRMPIFEFGPVLTNCQGSLITLERTSFSSIGQVAFYYHHWIALLFSCFICFCLWALRPRIVGKLKRCRRNQCHSCGYCLSSFQCKCPECGAMIWRFN